MPAGCDLVVAYFWQSGCKIYACQTAYTCPNSPTARGEIPPGLNIETISGPIPMVAEGESAPDFTVESISSPIYMVPGPPEDALEPQPPDQPPQH
jgi:hypothetical protein